MYICLDTYILVQRNEPMVIIILTLITCSLFSMHSREGIPDLRNGNNQRQERLSSKMDKLLITIHLSLQQHLCTFNLSLYADLEISLTFKT